MKNAPKVRTINMKAYGISAIIVVVIVILFVLWALSGEDENAGMLPIKDDVYSSITPSKPLEPAGYGFLRKPPPPPAPAVAAQPTPSVAPVNLTRPAPVRTQPTQQARVARPAVAPKPPEPMASFSFGESGIKDSGQVIQAQFGPQAPQEGGSSGGRDGKRSTGVSDENVQQREFLRGSGGGLADDIVMQPWMPAISEYMLRASTLIQATAINSVTTDLPGSIAAMVTRDVMDSIRGECVLIPAASILFGDTNDQVKYGQELMQVRWKRILFEDGSSQNIGAMSGTNTEGRSGIDGEVDHHYGPFFAAILGDAALKMLAQSGQYFQDEESGNINVGYAGAGAFGSSVSQAGNEIIRKELDRQNTISIVPGSQVGLFLTKDVALPPYKNCEG